MYACVNVSMCTICLSYSTMTNSFWIFYARFEWVKLGDAKKDYRSVGKGK